MSESWANHGLDLHLNLAGSRVRAGLEAALRDALRTGRLPAGVRLPSSRDLAADLGIARNTVAEAYAQLVAEGWLTARTGSGTWVSERPVAAAALVDAPARPSRGPRFDLRAGVPAVSVFPRREWLAATRAALAAAPDDVLGYPDPRGLRELRVALAGYLARTRGVNADPERIIICGGFAHGLALTCRLLGDRGVRCLAVESYGHQAYRRIVQAHGLSAIPLAVDNEGALPADLDASVGQPDGAGAVLLTPAHQFPLGMSLAPGRRTAFVTWAARTGGLVIEDDYDGEFRYDRQPVGAMQPLAPDHVVYAGTASKSLAPGLRLGWLVVPQALAAEYLAAKEAFGWHNSALDQLALARLIESGGYDRQVRRARLIYRRRRDRLVAALQRHAPRVRLTGIAAGQHAVAALPDEVIEDDVVARAARHGLSVDGLGHYAHEATASAPDVGGREWRPALVVGYGRPPEHAFTAALGRLCATLAEVT